MKFGSFETICNNIPSYPWCNILYSQLKKHAPSALRDLSADPATAPVGVNPVCGIQRIGKGRQGNFPNTIVAGLSIIAVLYLVARVSRRRAAVCRVEFRLFLLSYALSLVFQILTLGAFFEQGSTVLTVLTALHAGVIAVVFWILLANAIISTQVVEDGTPAALIPFFFGVVFVFAATLYVSLDTAFTFTTTLGPSNPPVELNAIGLFVVTVVWPAAAIALFGLLMGYVVLGVLQEWNPFFWYLLGVILFGVAEVITFVLSRMLCGAVNGKIDGSFLATLLQTAAVGAIYMAWRNMTEEEWSEEAYYGSDYK